MDDQRIISLLWERRESAIEALALRFGARLKATAQNILQNAEDAQECVSDTYFALWNTIPPKKPDPLAGFVYKTGRNLALKRLRDSTAARRDSRYDLSLDELSAYIPAGALEDEIEARLLGRAIDRFIGTVSKRSRVIFVRRYWFGDSVGTIAHALGTTQNSVSVQLSRTRAQLKDYLIKEGYLYE